MNRSIFAAAMCIAAALCVAPGCQNKKAGPPPVDRSSTTLYNSGELPPKANRTDARAFRGAKVVQTGMDTGPGFVPAKPAAVELQEP